MNLKNIVNKFYWIILISFAVSVQANDDSEFRYESTVLIINKVDKGGIIYLRKDEYNPINGFYIIYDQLKPYFYELEMLENEGLFVVDPDDITISLDFVTPNTNQQFYITDYLIGNGASWVPISEGDYNRISASLSARSNRKASITKSKALEEFIKRYRDKLIDSDAGKPELDIDESPIEQKRKDRGDNDSNVSTPKSTDSVNNVKDFSENQTEHKNKSIEIDSTAEEKLNGQGRVDQDGDVDFKSASKTHHEMNDKVASSGAANFDVSSYILYMFVLILVLVFLIRIAKNRVKDKIT